MLIWLQIVLLLIGVLAGFAVNIILWYLVVYLYASLFSKEGEARRLYRNIKRQKEIQKEYKKILEEEKKNDN